MAFRTSCRPGRPQSPNPAERLEQTHLSIMNDISRESGRVRRSVVRPRDAASLILLRGEGKELEVLAGRRPLHVRFMPGVHVFPGGAIDPPDRVPWTIETGTEALGPKLDRCARAAMRETWEEAGVLV